MIAVQVFIVLALYIYILFRRPEMRIAGSIIAFMLIGGLVAYMVFSPPEQQVERNRISIEDITLEGLELDIGPRTAMLTGSAINGSTSYTLTGVTIDITLYDCANDDTPLDACFTIGEDDGYARMVTPPGQLRDFRATFLFSNMPSIKGVLRWEHKIISTRALDTTNRPG
ncbi:MAG: hypothetical protein L3J37_07175 [Rhodobacteraceae bacterium]|nr:hypothetical protein [Paracoccaceae bacterium]